MRVQRINLDSELGIINSARVSYGAWKSELDDKDKKLIEFLKKHNHNSPFFHPQISMKLKGFTLEYFNKTDIAGLEWLKHVRSNKFFLRCSLFLYEKHKNVFLDNWHATEITFNEEWLLNQKDFFKASRLPYLSFRIKAPIFVVRQLEKHQIGMTKNERSGRYVKFDCEFYTPDKWRKKSPSNKQGSLQDEFVNQVEISLRGLLSKETLNLKQKFILFCLKVLQKDLYVRISYEKTLEMAEKWYHANIENEMCGEQARMILPLSTFTEFVWTGSLQDYARICSLRLKKDSQKETRDCVQMIYELCKTEYPNTFNKLIEMHENY